MTWGSAFEARDLVRILHIRRAGWAGFSPTPLFPPSPPSPSCSPPPSSCSPSSSLSSLLSSSSYSTVLYYTLSSSSSPPPPLLSSPLLSPSLLGFSSRCPSSLAITCYGLQHQVRVILRSLWPSSVTDASLILSAPQVHPPPSTTTPSLLSHGIPRCVLSSLLSCRPHANLLFSLLTLPLFFLILDHY